MDQEEIFLFHLCLDNQSIFRYNGKKTNKSAVTILKNALAVDKIYQFQVQISLLKQSSKNETGYIFVQKLQNSALPLISIAFVS